MRQVLAGVAAVGLLAGGMQTPVARAASKPLYLAVHESGSPNLLHTYAVAPNGALTPLAGSPVATHNTALGASRYCQTLGYSASRKLFFTSGGSGISVTDLSTGMPVLVAGSPFGSGVRGVAVVDKGPNTFVYGASYADDTILAYKVLANHTLQALPQVPAAAGDGPVGMTVVKDLVFAANETSGTISSYKVAVNGFLTPAPNPPVLPSASIRAVSADPQGKFVYAGDCALPRIFAFKVNPKTAALTPVAGSPFSVALDQVCAGALPAGKNLLFALNDNDEAPANLLALKRSAQGALQPLGTPVELPLHVGAVDPTARFLATVDQNADKIRTFVINKKTGSLLPIGTVNQPLGEVTAALLVEQ